MAHNLEIDGVTFLYGSVANTVTVVDRSQQDKDPAIVPQKVAALNSAVIVVMIADDCAGDASVISRWPRRFSSLHVAAHRARDFRLKTNEHIERLLECFPKLRNARRPAL